MNLEIFERNFSGKNARFDKPVLTIGTKVLYFNIKSMEEFDFVKEQRVVLSIDRESKLWYLCFLPELSIRRGYILSTIKKMIVGVLCLVLKDILSKDWN